MGRSEPAGGFGLLSVVSSEVEKEFRATASSVRAARAFVEATLAAWDVDDLSDVAVLLTSELTTNALRHARSAFRVRVVCEPPVVTVEVHDNSASPPRRRSPSTKEEGGRGLQLVEALANRWGSRAAPDGKVVWFQLRVA